MGVVRLGELGLSFRQRRKPLESLRRRVGYCPVEYSKSLFGRRRLRSVGAGKNDGGEQGGLFWGDGRSWWGAQEVLTVTAAVKGTWGDRGGFKF